MYIHVPISRPMVVMASVFVDSSLAIPKSVTLSLGGLSKSNTLDGLTTSMAKYSGACLSATWWTAIRFSCLRRRRIIASRSKRCMERGERSVWGTLSASCWR